MADRIDGEFFERMVESVGVGVAIYGADGAYRYVNRAYADLLGTDRESLTGTAVWEVVPEFERARFDDYWDSFGEGETRRAETEHSYGGTTVPVATVTTRHRIDGEPYNFGTIKDISERTARERELRRQNERLDSFAGIVSHDLRNPLNVAQGYLDILRTDVDRDELELVDNALSRMDLLVTDLLTLAREGAAVSELEDVALADVAEAAWRNVAGGEADFAVESDRELRADADRLQQLLENLFRNAVEHGDGAVAVRVGATADGFYVADDGPGVPPDRRETVFEPGVSTNDDGTGFGLAIVGEIAEAHGWTVAVADSWAGGARFEVRGVDG